MSSFDVTILRTFYSIKKSCKLERRWLYMYNIDLASESGLFNIYKNNLIPYRIL